MIRSQRCLILASALIAALFPSCSRDPNVRKQKYFQSGQSYFEKGKYAEAEIEFSNALKIDPNFADAHHSLAESYLKLQKADGAAEELARTVQLQPQNYEARLELANLLILGRRLREAQQLVDLLIPERPSDPAVHSALSNLLAAQGDVHGAIDEMQKTIALDPGRWQSYLSLALLEIRNNQYDAAEASFQKVIELHPTASGPRLLLGNYYQSRNRYADAEQQFQKAIDVDAKNPEPRAALARLYLAEGKKAEAEDVAKHAKQDLPDNSAAYRMLGNLYFVDGDFDKAVAEYSALSQQYPADLQVKKDYIQLLLQKNQISEASALDADILKANPNDNDALVYRSQMQISAGFNSEAITILQTVIKNDPTHSEAHYVLGVAIEKQGNTEGAANEWREALRLRPDLLDAVRALAALAMSTGDMDGLDQYATQMTKLQPDSPEGYSLRALSKVNRKRFSAAEVDVRKAIEIAPQSSFGYVQLGNLKFAQNQLEDAGKAYQAALDRNQNSKDALRGLLNTYVAQKHVDQAIAAANAQIAKVPNDGAFYDLLGTVLFVNQKDLAGAETAFTKSVELDKKSTDAQLKLAQVQAAKGSTDQAIATCRQGLENNPNEPAFDILLGDLYQSKKDWIHATEAYQKALALKPENPLASNDLAAVMLESGGNLDVALSLAQTARRGLPGSPGVADTLGWIYYQKGAYPLAVDSLREAVRLAQASHLPDEPQIHYHLGMAYAKVGQAALARQQLEKMLKMNPDSSDASDAKKQLAQLKS
jgi:tetratricopeptide (TPR) repeat protein